MLIAQKWSFVPWVNVLSWQIRFYWFELAAIHSSFSENVYSLSSENNQGQGKHFVAEVDVTNKGCLAEIVAQW